MNVVVTGGCGFIGSNLVEALRDNNHDVYIIDNMHTGNFANLNDTDYQGYRRNLGELRYLVTNNKPDVIFHLGIPSSAPMYDRYRDYIGYTIREWTELLDYVVHSPHIRVVWASTSSLYSGHPTPFTEDLQPMITSYYTECRYAMERLATLYHKLYDIQVIGLRLFSVYGQHETYKRQYANCLTQFLWGMMKGEAPVIYGDGSQTRDLIHVDDVVRAFIIASEADPRFGFFNVGTGVETSYNELVYLLNEALETAIIPQYVDNPIKNYVDRTCANVLNAAMFLGFRSKISLSDGINRMIEEYRDKL